MKNFINFLPPWVETNIQPAFYDKESGSCLQQTARMYAKVNQLVRIANEQYATIADYVNQFIELRDFVDDYFDNLDVQEEINNKLDAMATDGSLGVIISSYIQPYLATTENKLDAVESDVNALKASYGTPLTASDSDDMTNTSKIYVYTGTTGGGFTNGHWYYYNADNSTWTDGGTYQSSSVTTDKTVLIEGLPADAGFTGLIRNGMSKPAEQVLFNMTHSWYRTSDGTYPYNTNVLSTNPTVQFDDYVIITPPDGYRVGYYAKVDGVDYLTSFTTNPITLKPNVEYVIVFRHTGSDYDFDISEARKYKIEYGGSITPGQVVKEFDSGNVVFDFNTCKYESTYWVQPNGTTLTLANAPVQTSGILANENWYRLASTSREFMTQTFYSSNKKVYRRVVEINEGSWSSQPWVEISPEFASTYKDKKLAIYGDSISTFAGYIPSGNLTYYTGSNAGVSSVDDTWWKKAVDAMGIDLIMNNSWSGRTVSSYWDGPAGYKQSNIDVLSSNGTPEVIIVKLGINDFNRNVDLGSFDGTSHWSDDPSKFSEAYAIMLDRIMTSYPEAKVFCCTLQQEVRSGFNHNPEVNSNGSSLTEWNERIVKIAKAFGADIIDHASCGITEYNMSEYAGDYNSGTGAGLHPNAEGMSLIANKTIEDMDNEIRKRY